MSHWVPEPQSSPTCIALAPEATHRPALPLPPVIAQENESLGPAAAVFPYVWFLGLLYPLLVAVQIFFVLSGAGPVARGIASVLRMR